MADKFEPKLGSGNVSVVIDGEALTLVPTYAAMVAISARGGLRGVMERILQLEAETITDVLIAGLGYGPGRRPPKDLAERIWKTGFTLPSGALADAAFNYVSILANGGRPLVADDSSDDSSNDREARQDSAGPPPSSDK